MRKLVLRLGPSPVILADPSDPAKGLQLTTHYVNVSTSRAEWAVKVCPFSANEFIVRGFHGKEETLWKGWESSWIALCSPITLHVGGKTFRPEFVVYVPDNIELSQGGA